MWHRTILAFALTFVAGAWTPGTAQTHATDRGSFILSGGAGVSSQSFTYDFAGERHEASSRFAHLGPRVQYFVRPGLALGGSLDLSHSRMDEQTSTSYGLGPAISYYFAAPDRQLIPYVSAQTSFMRLRGEEFNQWGYGAGAGVLYMLTGSVGLDGGAYLRAHRVRAGDEGETKVRALGLAVGFSAFVF